MVLLGPGYNGSALDAGYIRIDGVDYRTSELEMVEDIARGMLGIKRFGRMLYAARVFSDYTDDAGSLAPFVSYDALLHGLAALHAYRYAGTQATKVISAIGTNEQLISAGRTLLYSIIVVNPAAASAFLKLYDMSNVPAPGHDLPIMTFDTRSLPAAPLSFGKAVTFHEGLGISITALADDLDGHSVGAGDVMLTLVWE